jgi:hypothetical protein
MCSHFKVKATGKPYFVSLSGLVVADNLEVALARRHTRGFHAGSHEGE